MAQYKSLIAMAVTSTLMLMGCDQGSKTTEAPAPAPAPKAAETAKTTETPAAAPSKDSVKLAAVQELVKGNGSEPASLDPNKTEGVPESNIQRDLFEGLVTTDPTGKIRPGVAENIRSRGAIGSRSDAG